MPPATASAAKREPSPIGGYVAAVAIAAVLAVVVDGVLLAMEARAGRADWLDLAQAAILATAFVLLHRYPFTFYWRDHRLVFSLDEAAILLALLVVPPVALAPAVLAGSIVIQWWFGPGAMVKRVFNAAQYALAAQLAAAVFAGLAELGVAPWLAGVGAAFSFSLAANLLLAGVFARLDRVGTLRVFRERLLVQGAHSGIASVSGALSLLALWSLHPLATLAVIPFGVFARQYWRLYAAADREIDVHRRLAKATHDLVGTSNVPAVAERVVAECERLLDCGLVELRLDLGDEPLSVSRTFGAGPQRQAEPIVAALPAHAGGTLGEIRVWARQGKDSFGEQERAVLLTMAGQAASALENARAIAEADAARHRLSTYLSTAQDAVMLADISGRIRYMNPAARRLFEVDETQVAGCRASDFFDDPRLALTSGEPPREPVLVDTEARGLLGRRGILVEAHAGPLVERGETTGVLMVVRDVTERKLLDEEMARQREALAQSEKLSALGTLIAGVAHEINNPLTFMRGNLQLSSDLVAMRLAEPSVTGEERQLLEDVREGLRVSVEGVDRISGIATSLKNVARRGTNERRPEDVNRIVQDVIRVVGSSVPRSIRLDLQLAESLPPVVAQASELHQVLLNLVKNSVEALEGREDGWIRVRSFAEEDRVCLEVADNGCGIPAEVQRSLFQAFFTTKEKGTGLGLSISRGIAQSHGGQLTVTSEEGQGTTFLLTLPVEGADGAETEPDAPAA